MAQTEFERGFIAGVNEALRVAALRVLDTHIQIPRGEQKELSQ